MLGNNSFHGPLGGCFKMALADALRKKLDLFSFYLTEKDNKTCLWKLEIAQGNS